MSFQLESNYKAKGDQSTGDWQADQVRRSRQSSPDVAWCHWFGQDFHDRKRESRNWIARPSSFSHNKTLAAQLYSEFKQFFPRNAVEYFVSYFDYYQPEAYIPRSDTYIEKDSSIQ